jgi:FMN reductase
MPATTRTLDVVGFCGNVHRPSKTRALVEAVIADIVAHRPADAVRSIVYDVIDLMPELGEAVGGADLPTKLRKVIQQLASADAIVVGSPVYKGSYSGLFKHFFDLIEPQQLMRLPVILTACGGGERHALVLEHQLRPLFGFFSAHTIATSIYASEHDFVDGCICSAPLRHRIEAAVADLAIWLDHGRDFKLTSASVPP